ncbi:MAG: hypothetical protein JO210_10685 [Acidobacteriaceae bacterium]|nr:hypothetical protein [Acidobacteriaceae bacterium]
MTSERKKAIAVLNDLMFTVKIQEAAKRARLDLVFVKSQGEALERAREDPALIIVDLNHTGAEPLQLISTLKGSAETSGIPLIGYVSHVQVDLRQAAQEAGCDVVVARSAFVQNLPELLTRFAGSGETG